MFSAREVERLIENEDEDYELYPEIFCLDEGEILETDKIVFKGVYLGNEEVVFTVNRRGSDSNTKFYRLTWTWDSWAETAINEQIHEVKPYVIQRTEYLTELQVTKEHKEIK